VNHGAGQACWLILMPTVVFGGTSILLLLVGEEGQGKEGRSRLRPRGMSARTPPALLRLLAVDFVPYEYIPRAIPRACADEPKRNCRLAVEYWRAGA